MSTQPLHIFTSTSDQELPLEKLYSITRSIFRGEHIAVSKGVNLICCSDYRIRKLNGDYRDSDKVTDVLSFPFEDDDFIGEVYISLQRVAVQARRYGFSFEEEFLRLYIHGLLHLSGYDHIKEGDRILMEKTEQKYLKKLSITI